MTLSSGFRDKQAWRVKTKLSQMRYDAFSFLSRSSLQRSYRTSSIDPMVNLSGRSLAYSRVSCRRRRRANARQHYYIRAAVTINAANIPHVAIRNATCDLRCHNTRTSSLKRPDRPSLAYLRTFFYITFY